MGVPIAWIHQPPTLPGNHKWYHGRTRCMDILHICSRSAKGAFMQERSTYGMVEGQQWCHRGRVMQVVTQSITRGVIVAACTCTIFDSRINIANGLWQLRICSRLRVSRPFLKFHLTLQGFFLGNLNQEYFRLSKSRRPVEALECIYILENKAIDWVTCYTRKQWMLVIIAPRNLSNCGCH